jgi:hypothetical protein
LEERHILHSLQETDLEV